MVNICGKCLYFMRSETTGDGDYYHYCGKVDELYPPEPDTCEDGEEIRETPKVLKIRFNDSVCEYYKKKR